MDLQPQASAELGAVASQGFIPEPIPELSMQRDARAFVQPPFDWQHAESERRAKNYMAQQQNSSPRGRGR